MKPWHTIDRAPSPDGGELVLQERDGQFTIRVGGQELMSSRSPVSELEMAKVGLERIRAPSSAQILIGGLGLGYTLRATLDLLPPSARVTVAELSAAIVRWNKGPVAKLANAPLEDDRVTLLEKDVRLVLRESAGQFDTVLLDVDNGPTALTVASNDALYSENGTRLLWNALKPRGTLVVWSAASDTRYLSRLGRAGFDAEVRPVSPAGKRHWLFVARRKT